LEGSLLRGDYTSRYTSEEACLGSLERCGSGEDLGNGAKYGQ